MKKFKTKHAMTKKTTVNDVSFSDLGGGGGGGDINTDLCSNEI